MDHRRARWALGSLTVASAFTLALVKVHDTDAWTHLALGRSIVQAGGFPPTEPFTFPGLQLPYYNPEWLFGLAFYAAFALTGIAGVVSLKAALIALAFFVLVRDSLLPADPPSHRTLGAALVATLLALFAVAIRPRFVERPDLALMLFLAFTTYALNAYLWAGRRLLYLLPLLQVVWVNTHPSIVVGVVPFAAVLLGGGLQHRLASRRGIELDGTPSPRQLRVVAAVFAGVLLASLLNPYGVDPYLAPFRLAASAWFRHEITELQAPRWPEHPAPFVVTALLALAFAATLRRLSLVSVLLVAPFVYLALSARRFFVVLAVVSAPVLARHLRRLVSRLPDGRARRLALPAGALAAIVIATATGLAVGGVEPSRDLRQVPGFGINQDVLPEGALRYLDRVGLQGRIFNTFQWGGYIAWRDFPRRTPFVDGRGYLPVDVLEEMLAARSAPERLERLRRRYGFDVILVNYPRNADLLGQETPDVDLALASPDWALVYWDDVALVYVWRTEPYRALIGRDEYRLVKPANGALALRPKLADARGVAAVEAELDRNIAETGSSTALALLGFVQNEIGAWERAIEVLGRVPDRPGTRGLGAAWAGLAFAHARLGRLEQAIAYYDRAVRLREDPLLRYSLGLLLANVGDHRAAIRQLERARELDPRLAPVYPALVAAYRRVGDGVRARALEAAYPGIVTAAQAEEHFRRGTRLYVQRRYEEAIAEFKASIRVNPRSPSARSNLGWVYFDQGRFDLAFAEQKAALDIDRGFANAHYGLALVYLKAGERAQARDHFQEYLRLAPSGYWSRRASEELDRLR